MQEDGTWLNQRGGSEAIKLLADKVGYQLMLPTERKCYTYDGDLLTQVTYPNGGSFQYNYDESGLILSVRDLNVKTFVKNTYDRDSRVTRQEMINGGEYVYFYDTQNRLTTCTEVHTGQRQNAFGLYL